jgi:general stress protein CsbA
MILAGVEQYYKCAHQTFIIQYLDVLTLQLGMVVIEKNKKENKNARSKKKK